MKIYRYTFFLSRCRSINRALFFFLVLLAVSCKEKFDSPAPPIDTGYLVIEGVINNDGDTTNIKLSRTASLNDNTRRYETDAIVHLEDDHNNSLLLTDNNGIGTYTITNLHLDNSYNYRLNIKTANGEEYKSDFVPIKNNPPIDSINWVQEEQGVRLFINTHDPQNNTRYYQWEYNETWEFHTLYSDCKYVPLADPRDLNVVHRDVNDPQIFKCWKSKPSSLILLGSSAKLEQDIIHLPLIFIPNADEKLSVMYSILVKQYAWSKEGYEFLDRMRKNTESVGSIFDAQPSELNSNFHCVSNPSQPVIGFFNICTIREKRIFIDSKDLSHWNFRLPCNRIAVVNNPDSIRAAGAVYMLPTVSKLEVTSIIEFYASEASCVDCRLTGTNVKPDYWP
jgi:hypothetical protein